ncbi:Ion channel [Roseibium alexandrii]|uniref:Ion channel n=2 Tax=Roseibium alexandrii TaxID=388408 RepID=A0A0M7ALF0_9HYPH|nr:Ion channel [Roseibium alexandrii]
MKKLNLSDFYERYRRVISGLLASLVLTPFLLINDYNENSDLGIFQYAVVLFVAMLVLSNFYWAAKDVLLEGFRLRFILNLVFLNYLTIVVFADAYARSGVFNSGGDIVRDGAVALYFSTVTWTTLGYGDYRPQGFGMFLAPLQAVLGMYSVALVFGLIVGAVVRFETEKRNSDDQ